jgi:hypothetical protein
MISYKNHREHKIIKTLISSHGRLDGWYNPSSDRWQIDRNEYSKRSYIILDNKDII